MESQHVKSINTDERSNKRIKFASAKERSKRASADVYRSYKRKIGVTSAATREESVHNRSANEHANKRHRAHHLPIAADSRTALLRTSTTEDDDDASNTDMEIEVSTTFASELDVALDRNASEIFGKFHRQVWGLVRSLPEILHYSEKIIDLMMSHLLSPISKPERPSDLGQASSSSQRLEFVVNCATTDILHLLAVLARDLRFEIHPYLHEKILPRIILDLLNPPPPPPGSEKQPIPMGVTLVEAAFRTISYLLKYDADMILEDMEAMRKHYGSTLVNRRELIRRLAAETFAPLIRKIKSQNSRQRHLKRVLRALAATADHTMTHSFKRTQQDAIDGISQLIFQLVRGVPGRMHSNGHHTVGFLFSFCAGSSGGSKTKEKDVGSHLIVSVAAAFLDRLCHHMAGGNFTPAFDELVASMKASLSDFATTKDAKFQPVLNMLKLMAQVSDFRSGALLQDQSDQHLKGVFDSMEKMFSQQCFTKVPAELRCEVLTLASSVWNALQQKTKSSDRLLKCLKCVFQCKDGMSAEQIQSIRLLAAVLSNDLLPHLDETSSVIAVGSTILTAAAKIAELDIISSLLIVFSVATRKLDDSDSIEQCAEVEEKTLFSDTGTSYNISASDKEILLDRCLLEIDKKKLTADAVSQIGVALRCIPFLTHLRHGSEPEKTSHKYYKMVSKWIIEVMKALEGVKDSTGEVARQEIVVVKSIALAALANVSTMQLDSTGSTTPVEKTLIQAKPMADRLVFSDSGSLWAVMGISSLVRVLSRLNQCLNDKMDETFDALMPNLRNQSHSLRFYSLQILTSYPEKSFVTDHADLDFDGDLDEEPSFRPSANTEKKRSGPVGPCDILKTMLKLESTQIRFANERALLGLVSRIEVLGRTGKLPVVYAEAAGNFLLGSFYVKFSPMWPAAARALVSLTTAHENIVWPALEAKLVDVMQRPLARKETEKNAAACADIACCDDHRDACIKWEISHGLDISVFQCSGLMVEDGEVPRHFMTDEETVMETVWKVAESIQQLMAKHSRVIVPVFLGFLHNQYYIFHTDDPDARELCLDEVVDKESFELETLEKYALQRRLMCFFKAFAAINGPQQLVHHALLERIFRSFLINQDPSVVELALSCLLKYKPTYLVPYSEILKEVLQKGRLRNALLKFGEEIESGKVDDAHRYQLLPIIARILFGRLSSRGTKSSSKDSPAARRAAILSFLSVLCKDESDLFPFIYLMTRSFIPRNAKVKDVESYSVNDRDEVIRHLNSVKAENLARLPSGVVEGFLHLLGTVISQLGHRIIVFVPTFTSISLALCQLVAVDRSKNEEDESAEDKTTSLQRDRVCEARYGQIRTLCYQSLSEIFGRFGASADLFRFGDSLWKAIGGSLDLLPEMVIKSQKVPALLHLLETLSSEPRLIKLITSRDKAVAAVIKCITDTSFSAVMTAALTFIENLLADDAPPDSNYSEVTGISLVRKEIPLLIEQFTCRLGNANTRARFQQGHTRGTKSPSNLRQTTWRRELHILCRVSELISDGEGVLLKDKTSVLENMCNLLLPFLEPDKVTSDEDKMNVLGILKSTIGQLDPDFMLTVFATLSNTLAPAKSRPGIQALTVRRSIAELIAEIAATNHLVSDVADKLMKLSAVHSKRVDEIDFTIVIPALNALCDENGKNGWVSMCENCGSDPSLLAPVISTCFHFLHNEDGVLARTSVNTIKTLVRAASSQHDTEVNKNTRSEGGNDQTGGWTKLIEASVVPLARSGLQGRNPAIRRYCILIIQEMSKCFRNHSSPNLCGDLSILCNDENPDLDFFVNITHVQIHRRSRAFQRLRNVLAGSTQDNSQGSLTAQSLSTVLLSIAMHPAYECKAKAEENFALEAIATVGAISRHLSWNKYNNTLWTILANFDRHPEQERYLIGMMCAIIDNFSYDLVEIGEDRPGVNSGAQDPAKSSVWRSLEKRLIPKIEALLTKETVDKHGSRVKTIRPTIVLALLKLFQKFPQKFFESKLPHILSVMCDALRNKESNARDTARNTLAKIAVSMDLKYLADVIRELAITLNEGYKLHVRAAVINTILQEISSVYQPLPPESSHDLPFDKCTAALMDVIQDDLFGVANERRESQETNVRYVKEAGGSKSIHSIELICRMITFKPSDASKGSLSRSAIHCVVSPLLERLRLPEVDAAGIRKVREILMRVVIGVSHNPSVRAGQLFPFVYATIQPFVGSQIIAAVLEEDDDDSVDDADRPLKISGAKESKPRQKRSSSGKVVEWRPSTLKASDSSKAAMDMKKKDSSELMKVRDGVSAPKLTGSSRHGLVDNSGTNGLNDPATINAVSFGLNLLNSCVKNMKLDAAIDVATMIDPFVPMLTACVCHCRDTDVALISLKCIMSFLRFKLPSISSCSKSLGTQALSLLTSGGSSLNQNHDLTQACFKTLTYLINTDAIGEKKKVSKAPLSLLSGVEGENVLAESIAMPLQAEQMKVLISILQVSIAESDQHNPALGLIRAVLSRRYTSPEFYDLMEAMLKTVVRSQKASLRQQSAGIFIRYLLDYPMGEDRFGYHLKQVVANVSYEYQDGRIAALNLLTSLIEKLPVQLLEKHAQLIFLPLVLQMVNDDSKDCRESVSKCLVLLLTRSTTEVLGSFHDYTVRWSKNAGPLRIASLQVFGIFAESCSDYVRKNNLATLWIQNLQELLQETQSEWEISYFAMITVEKLALNFEAELLQHSNLWKCIVEQLIEEHPWTKLASSRIIRTLFASSPAVNPLFQMNPGMLFEICRNLCFQLNVQPQQQSEDLSDLAIKTLTSALPIMQAHPELCFAEDTERKESEPVAWLMRRLCEIAKPKGVKRRMALFKCFAAFTTHQNTVVAPYMKLMLEPLHRANLEASNELDNPSVYKNIDMASEDVVTEASLAGDVLQLLEESCASPEEFLTAYAAVKSRARDKKTHRKSEAKAAAVQDPRAHALRKINKQQREKHRVKRRVDEKRRDRGAFKKRPRSFG